MKTILLNGGGGGAGLSYAGGNPPQNSVPPNMVNYGGNGGGANSRVGAGGGGGLSFDYRSQYPSEGGKFGGGGGGGFGDPTAISTTGGSAWSAAGLAPAVAGAETGDHRPEQAATVASAAAAAAGWLPTLPAVKSTAAMAAVTVAVNVQRSMLGGGGAGAGMGGAVFNYEGTVIITNSTFAGNAAKGGAGGYSIDADPGGAGDGLGGGVFNYDGALTVNDSTFSSNIGTQRRGPQLHRHSRWSTAPTAPARPQHKSTIPSSARATPPCPIWWSIRSIKVRPR